MDHVFTLRCIIDFFLAKKKRLYCMFIDYEKAFDRVERAFLWQKLLDSGVDGRVLTVIKDMYRKAKSCVKTGSVCSDDDELMLNVLRCQLTYQGQCRSTVQ